MTGAPNTGAILDSLPAAAGAAVVCALVAWAWFWVRSVSRRAAAAASSCDGRPESWPRRGHYLLLAVFVTIAGVYGSLVPFSYRPLELHEAVEQFNEIPYLSLGTRDRADLLENVCLFALISYCWMAALAVDCPRSRRAAWTAALVVLLSVALSIALEFTQLWFPPRTVSQNDLMAEAAGAMFGAGLWLAVGQAATQWVRSFSGASDRKQQLDWLLQAYCVGLVVWSLVPFDFVLSTAELAEKERAGMIRLVPFSDSSEGLNLAGLLRSVVVFIPVGMLAVTWRIPDGQRARGIVASVLLGGLVVLIIELAQVAVYTRSASSEDVIAGALGVLAGAWGMRRWRLRRRETTGSPASGRSAGRAWLWLGLAGAYSLLLAIVLCAPFELSGVCGDLAEIEARLAGLGRVPFAGLYRTLDLEAASDVLRKLLFFAPLGALGGLAVASLVVGRWAQRLLLAAWLLVAAAVGLAIELVQVFLPAHVPENTDVIVYATGAALGMLVAVGMAGRGRGSVTPA